jgi:hypothetical protein
LIIEEAFKDCIDSQLIDKSAHHKAFGVKASHPLGLKVSIDFLMGYIMM